MKKVLEICSEATVYNNYNDWWWKFMLGKVYNKLGMLGEAEKQFVSSLKNFKSSKTILYLTK